MTRFRLFSVVDGKRHALVETEASDHAAAVAAGKAKWPDQRIEAEEVTGAASRAPAGVTTPPGGTLPMHGSPPDAGRFSPGQLLRDESTLYASLHECGLSSDCAIVVARAVTNLATRVAALEAAYLDQPLVPPGQ